MELNVLWTFFKRSACYRVISLNPSFCPCPCNQLIKHSAPTSEFAQIQHAWQTKKQDSGWERRPLQTTTCPLGQERVGMSPKVSIMEVDLTVEPKLGAEPQTSEARLSAQPVWVQCEWLRDLNWLTMHDYVLPPGSDQGRKSEISATSVSVEEKIRNVMVKCRALNPSFISTSFSQCQGLVLNYNASLKVWSSPSRPHSSWTSVSGPLITAVKAAVELLPGLHTTNYWPDQLSGVKCVCVGVCASGLSIRVCVCVCVYKQVGVQSASPHTCI